MAFRAAFIRCSRRHSPLRFLIRSRCSRTRLRKARGGTADWPATPASGVTLPFFGIDVAYRDQNARLLDTAEIEFDTVSKTRIVGERFMYALISGGMFSLNSWIF